MTYYLYAIEFPNRRRYVGVTDNPRKRFNAHKNMAKNPERQYAMVRAIRKYGLERPWMKILLRGPRHLILQLEPAFIRLFAQGGYNSAEGGEENPFAGQRHTIKAKIRMREQKIGGVLTAEHKGRISESLRRAGPHSAERKRSISLGLQRSWNRRKGLV